MAHPDILEQRESLRSPLMGSVALHVALVLALGAFAWLDARGREQWGDPLGGGGSIGITPVSQLPLPPRPGPANPLANDTQSNVPLPPKEAAPVKETKPEPKPDAIPMPSKTPETAKPRQQTARQQFRPDREPLPNQVYSREGQALASDMMGGTPGSGGVGIGSGSPFGNRFGAYLELIRQRVAEKWQTGNVNPRLSTAPPVVVSFELMRDGSVRDVRILQSSGDATLDYSAQRAVYGASPLPPIPAGFERSSATIEFRFFLKR
jgi:periplasmic protein TonB